MPSNSPFSGRSDASTANRCGVVAASGRDCLGRQQSRRVTSVIFRNGSAIELLQDPQPIMVGIVRSTAAHRLSFRLRQPGWRRSCIHRSTPITTKGRGPNSPGGSPSLESSVELSCARSPFSICFSVLHAGLPWHFGPPPFAIVCPRLFRAYFLCGFCRRFLCRLSCVMLLHSFRVGRQFAAEFLCYCPYSLCGSLPCYLIDRIAGNAAKLHDGLLPKVANKVTCGQQELDILRVPTPVPWSARQRAHPERPPLDIVKAVGFEPCDRHFTDTISKLRKRLLRVAKNRSKCKQAKK